MLRDKLGHTKLRKYLSGHISCLDSLKATQLRKTTLVALEQVHLVFESLLALKPHLKPILNQQQQSYMIKFFNAFEQTENEMRRSIINPHLRHAVNSFAADIFTDIQHVNWGLPSVKTQESSFVGKV